MATTIVTKNSSTASAVPTAAQLVQGELAVNVADKRIYTENNAGAVVELGTNPSTLTVAGEITANGGIALGDNDKATFGDSDDLQIYHDGSASYVTDTGTGDLILQGTNIQLRSASTKRVLQGIEAGATKIFYDNAEKLATTSTGIDVTGSVTADKVTVGTSVVNYSGTDLTVGDNSDSQNGIAIQTSTTGNGYILFGDGSGASSYRGEINYSHSTDSMTLKTAGTNRLDIASNGDISFYEDTGTTAKLFWDASAESLGIGTSSPTSPLHIKSATDVNVRFDDSGSSSYTWYMNDAQNLYIPNVQLASTHTFYANGQRKVDIDSSGNLLVGKTATGFGTAGIELRSNGELWATTGVTNSASFNRTGSYGAVITINSANTPVGSIGTAGGGLTIGNGDTGVFFDAGNDNIRPFSLTTNNSLDAAIDLGRSTTRFKDLYLSGGVYLGGTGAANLLDDYEEGTTSMTWSDGTNHSGVVVGKYTKVGRIVTVEGNIGGSLSGLTQTNDILISGFPFVFNAKGSFSLLTRYLNAPDNTNSVIGYHDSSGSTALVFFVVDNGTYVTAKVQDFNQNTNDTYFSLTYTTA